MNKAILVTGATGFIGRALVASLQPQAQKVIALGSSDGDICKPDTLRKWLGEKVGAVVHLAGRSFVPDSWQDPGAFIAVNAGGTSRVLEFCRQTGARLVLVSGYVYGVPESLPISESAPVRPNNPYALSKSLAEAVCSFYATHCGVHATIIRPFNVYGSGQPSHFLIPKILRQVLAGTEIEVMDLEPRRDWVYVDDVASALVAAVQHGNDGYNVYNVGSGVSHSVADVIAIAQEVAKTRLAVRSLEVARLNELQDVVADIAKARRELGWQPRVGLVDGIRRTLLSMTPQL